MCSYDGLRGVLAVVVVVTTFRGVPAQPAYRAVCNITRLIFFDDERIRCKNCITRAWKSAHRFLPQVSVGISVSTGRDLATLTWYIVVCSFRLTYEVFWPCGDPATNYTMRVSKSCFTMKSQRDHQDSTRDEYSVHPQSSCHM